MRFLICLMVLPFFGCGLLVEEETAWTGDPCLDYEITDWWPMDAASVTHLPGAIVDVNASAGGFDADGIGMLIPTEVAWDGVFYLAQNGISTIGLPMEPGTYAVRTQMVGCPAQGNDYYLTVALPEPLVEAANPVLNGADEVATAVTWLDNDRAVFVVGSGGKALVVFDATEASLKVAYECGPCGTGMAVSPDGQWLANGGHLFKVDGDSLQHWTTFEGKAPLFSWDSSLLYVSQEQEGALDLVVAINLATGEQLGVLYSGTGIQTLTKSGLALSDGLIFDLASGALASPFGVPTGQTKIELWEPEFNRAIVATTGASEPEYVGLAQVFPFQLVNEPLGAVCAPLFSDRKWAQDPLGELAVAYGRKPSLSSYAEDFFEICRFSGEMEDWGTHWSIPYGGIASEPVVEAEWSPDGHWLASAGVGGIGLRTREEIEAFYP